MGKYKYEIKKNYVIYRNDLIFDTLNNNISPTCNCQIFSINNMNSIYVLSLSQIKDIIFYHCKNYSKSQLLITLSDKRSIKKFNKFLDFYKINSKLIVESETNISYLILKTTLISCLK